MNNSELKLYIAVHDDFPDYMVPTLVAHSILAAHMKWYSIIDIGNPYLNWLTYSFKKVVVRVNQKEFDKISQMEYIHLGHESRTIALKPGCIVVCPRQEYPNVLKYAKMWKPKETE